MILMFANMQFLDESTEKSRLGFNALLKAYPSLQQVLQNIKQVVWVIEPASDRVLYVSPGFEMVWGHSC